jgi:hypothetical protein
MEGEGGRVWIGSLGWRGRRRSFLGGSKGFSWLGWVPEPTPIPISTDSLVLHRPAQLGVMMGALRSCAGLDVRTGHLWVEIGAGQAFET